MYFIPYIIVVLKRSIFSRSNNQKYLFKRNIEKLQTNNIQLKGYFSKYNKALEYDIIDARIWSKVFLYL